MPGGAAWLPTVPDQDQWQREIRFAEKVQRCLLAAEPVALNRFAACGCSVPLFAVGGDYYDFVPLPDGGLRVVVADVMGKGFGAAMIMTMVRASVRAISPVCGSPGQLLRSVNHLLYDDMQRLESFVVMLCLDLPKEGTAVRLASAGAPPPLLLRSAPSAVERVQVRGVSLGLLPDREYREAVLETEEGDLLVLYTDGIIEARSAGGTELGWSGLGYLLQGEMAQPLPELVESVIGQVASHGGAAGLRDDVTLVAVRVSQEREEGIGGAAGCRCRT
ncbi:MAG: PP2C family protein-serine/threonine phosphatase [Bacillota bacterium]